jgi:succinoglycan biosynthesis protein ExoM
VVIAIVTFRRPACLSRVLPEVVRQAVDYPGSASALIVDNDPEGGAADQVRSWAGHGVRYLHEPKPGIAAARNAALRAATADLLVFIDDDGLPRDGWLTTLVRSWCTWRSAGVAGPALARFESGEPDEWVAGSKAFDRRSHPTGTLVRGASTSNLLLHLPQLREMGLEFDERFGLTGGSDSMLTHSVVKSGGELRWCDEAEVYDYHSAVRLTHRWVLRRNFRTGNALSRVKLALADSRESRVRVRLGLLARALIRIGRGTVGLTAGLATSDVGRRAAGACLLSGGLGVAMGAIGIVAVEYGRSGRSVVAAGRVAGV